MNLLFLGATGVYPLGVMVADTLNLFVIFQLLDRSASQRPINLQSLHKGTRGDKLHLWHFCQKSSIQLFLKLNLVLVLVARLPLAPFLYKRKKRFQETYAKIN